MFTLKERFVTGGAIVAALAVFFFSGAYYEMRADSLVEFAQDGVTVKVGAPGIGSGNLIAVPGGVGLLLASEFELTNRSGETRHIVLCNGHPDFFTLLQAAPSKAAGRGGYRVWFHRAGVAIADPHDVGGWWIRHLGLEKLIRVYQFISPPPFDSLEPKG